MIETPEITICDPTVAVLIGALSASVTRLPASLMAVIEETCEVPTLGKVKVVVVPSPVETALSPAGKNAVTESFPPEQRLAPALATKTRELLGTMAAWVGFTPMLAWPMSVSPETSIWSAAPGFKGTLALMPKTVWKFAGFGGVVFIG